MCDLCNKATAKDIPEDVVYKNNHIVISKIDDTHYIIFPVKHISMSGMYSDMSLMGYVGRAKLDIMERLACRSIHIDEDWSVTDDIHAIIHVEIER